MTGRSVTNTKSSGKLVLCATPIGNLGDASPRLAETLEQADLILAEDTRRSRILLEHMEITTTVLSWFDHQQQPRTDKLSQELNRAKTVAFLTDAGTPLVSDPGFEAVRTARQSGSNISIVPGPSAVTAAWAVAGWGGNRFCFEGYLPEKTGPRQQALSRLKRASCPTVLLVAPHKLRRDFEDLIVTLSGRQKICVVRELTKVYEEIWWGSLDQAQEKWTAEDPRGEFTVVLDRPPVPPSSQRSYPIEAVSDLVEAGAKPTTSVRWVAKLAGVDRKELYLAYVQSKSE